MLRDAVAGLYPLAELGAAGRAHVEREGDREIPFARYRRVVLDAAARVSR